MLKKIVLTGLVILSAVFTCKAVTIELWPAERRLNNTVYCIGNEQNHLLFNITSRTGLGKHKLKLPDKLEKPVTLSVDLPQSVKYLGSVVFCEKEFRKITKGQPIEHDGKPFVRHTIELNNKELSNRVLAHKWYYFINIWIQVPEKLDSRIYWKLNYGKDILAKASSRLVTAGTISPNAKLPKHFKFEISAGGYHKVPNNDFDKTAAFLKNVGINGITYNYSPKGLSDNAKAYYQAMRKAGVKNIANRAGSFMSLWSGKPFSPEGYGQKGLVGATAEAAKAINSPMEREYFSNVAEYFDSFNFDYEPHGPETYPGFDDTPTIEAFAKAKGINEKLTPELLKTTYRKDYFNFRYELLSRPVFALRKMIDSVKPMPLSVEQGSGTHAHIDYRVYDKAVDFHNPMIYTASPVDYYLRTHAASKILNPKKFYPVNSIGWTFAGMMRQTPQGVLMDTVTTAATGCGGIRHWPGLNWMDDGTLYGFHKGLEIVAHGDEFYHSGRPVTNFIIKGLPLMSKKINVGARILDLSQPSWKNSIFNSVYKLNNDYLITILNFNQEYSAFVEIENPVLKNCYLVNPVSKEFINVGNHDKTIVNVPKFSPALWIVTKDTNRLKACKELNKDQIVADFNSAKETFQSKGKSNVELTKKGNINVDYQEIQFGPDKIACLTVATPNQKVSFGSSGGRIFDWTVNGISVVCKKVFSTDGFCLDLLWLPSPARWTGDHDQDMRLAKCTNNGKEATIVYSGEFKKGFPNLRIVKTYRILAAESTIYVNIKLINGTALPVTVSYWNHNVLAFNDLLFVGKKAGTPVIAPPKSNTIFPNKSLPEEYKKFVNMPNNIVDSVDNIYADYIAPKKLGIIFKLPTNFMNIYRWNSKTTNMAGSEWMTQPITIPAGRETDIPFSIQAVSDTTPEQLKTLLK
jgi:hypothetical protein